MHLILIATIITGSVSSDLPAPWDPAEHRALADSVLQIVLRDLGDEAPPFGDEMTSRLGRSTPIWRELNFGRLTEHFAQADGDASRFQTAGKSVYEQLTTLARSDLESYWAEVRGRFEGGEIDDPIMPRSRSVVANYVLAHLAALHLADLAGSSSASAGDALRQALVYESVAQGYLADSHSSGHLLVPRHDAFQGLHPVNNNRAHGYYDSEGIYVVNGRYEAWEAFGDGVLSWYAQSYRQVLAAGVASMREVFLVYYSAKGSIPPNVREWADTMSDLTPENLALEWLRWKDGRELYVAESSSPALNYIPMPAAATWSIRSLEKDEHGVRIRRHYPQFRETGFHDPDLLDVVRSELYSREAFPPRFVPEELRSHSDPVTSANGSRDAASVEFVQIHTLPANYGGLLIEMGGGALIDDDGSSPAISGRIGYGLADDILVATHLSVNAGITKTTDGAKVSPVTLTAGINPGGLPIRAEVGYATTTDDFLSESGLALSAAYDVTTQVLGLTYVGVAVRLRYGVMLFDRVVHSTSIQLAFH